MNKQRIIYLLNAYQQQTATPQERVEFAKLLHNERYTQLFNEQLDQNWDELTSEEIDQIEIPGYDRILQEITLQPQMTGRKKNLWPRMVAAAAILTIIGTGIYFFKSSSPTINTEFTTKTDIAPGKDGATLTLANGKKIIITAALAGNIATESGVKIVKTKDGQLIYEITGNAEGPLAYNTLSTSKGEQTQVRLPDGTVVYLNAESSLKYPTSFAKATKRQVSLTGEAYFEVTKDKLHPFVVNADHQNVEVLGTTFNISSYADEPTVKTTLLEGSVRISQLETQNSKLLVPGEQAIVDAQSLLTKTVKVDDVVAWKNGYFMFNNETLENIMKKVARWYNVEILYKGDAVKQKTFFGSVSRFDHVSEILKLLQKTEGATFEIQGKQIIVSQK
jgi:transmembrane sensor